MNQKDYKAISGIMSKFRADEIARLISRDLAHYFEKEEQNNIKTNHPLWLDKEVLKEAKKIIEQFLKNCGVLQ